MFNTDLERTIQWALEASVYVAPTDYGLTHAELVEVVHLVGAFKEGQVVDALGHLGSQVDYDYRKKPVRYWREQPSGGFGYSDFGLPQQHDPRNIEAFEFVHRQLREAADLQGAAKARVERSVILARGEQQGHARPDLQLSITSYLLDKRMTEADGVLAFAPHRAEYPSPKEQQAQWDAHIRRHMDRRPGFEKILAVVREVLGRRTEGRPPSQNALKSFPNYLERLGYPPPVRTWWVKTAEELERASGELFPGAVLVLAASLCEGALLALFMAVPTFRAANREAKMGKGSKNVRFTEDLIKVLRGVFPEKPLTPALADRAIFLNDLRQRIHLGRLLDAPERYPNPDARPEEARAALETTHQIVRAVIDWVEKNPPPYVDAEIDAGSDSK